MVNIIMGLKGSGKTKKLVNLVREAVNEGTGDVVVIEKERKLTFDIPYQARLIDAGDYDIGSYEFLKGLICGVSTALPSGTMPATQACFMSTSATIANRRSTSLLS